MKEICHGHHAAVKSIVMMVSVAVSKNLQILHAGINQVEALPGLIYL